MMCPCCEAVPIAVTLTTKVGIHSVCASCAIKGGDVSNLSALNEVMWLEFAWRRGSLNVGGLK